MFNDMGACENRRCEEYGVVKVMEVLVYDVPVTQKDGQELAS
jgi:hypothetical protein